MINYSDLSDQELDGLIQDLSQKVAKAKIVGEHSEAFINLNNTYNLLSMEQNSRYNQTTKLTSGVSIESDPSMADVPFVDHTRKIPTF